jgi:hypothetical protein
MRFPEGTRFDATEKSSRDFGGGARCAGSCGYHAVHWLTAVYRPAFAPCNDRKFEATRGRLKRGEYLVNAVASCFACHSEPDSNVPGIVLKAGHEGAGRIAGVDPDLCEINIPNITPDNETGIGSWTDDESRALFAKAWTAMGARCFPDCPMTTSNTCRTRTLRPSLSIYAPFRPFDTQFP